MANPVGYPGGMAISSTGKIVLDDQKNIAIYTYNAPVKGSLGTPIATTPLTGAGHPISIEFARKDKGIWVADPASGGEANKALVSSADKYQYTAGGVSTRDILFSHGSQPTGIVLSRRTSFAVAWASPRLRRCLRDAEDHHCRLARRRKDWHRNSRSGVRHFTYCIPSAARRKMVRIRLRT